MADLVSGRYQQQAAYWSALGQIANATQSDIPPRSNVEWFGPKTEALGTITTEKGLFAAIPVTLGDTFSNVRIGTVTTASESGGEFIAAIYSGLAVTKETKVIAESAVTKEELKTEKGISFALKSSVLMTSEVAPFGYVYAGFYSKETTVALKVSGWKVTAASAYTSLTVKQNLGPFYCLTEASTGSFASAKKEFEVIGTKASTEVPYIILT